MQNAFLAGLKLTSLLPLVNGEPLDEEEQNPTVLNPSGLTPGKRWTESKETESSSKSTITSRILGLFGRGPTQSAGDKAQEDNAQGSPEPYIERGASTASRPPISQPEIEASAAGKLSASKPLSQPTVRPANLAKRKQPACKHIL